MRFVDKYKDIFYLHIYNLYRQQKYAHQQHNYKTTQKAVAKNAIWTQFVSKDDL